MTGFRHPRTTLQAMEPKKIAIVGGGIIGCSTAYRLSTVLPSDKCQITLISDKFSPHTTSDLSSGCLIPFDVTYPPSSDSVEGVGDIRRWARETIDHAQKLYLSPDVVEVGITHIYGCEAIAVGLDSDTIEDPWWTYLTHGFRRITDEEEKKAFNVPSGYNNVISFGLYLLDSRVYLPWLMSNFRKNCGIVKQQKITDLAKLAKEYDIVINCTGLGAYDLVSDKDIFPISGEAMSLNAPWLKNFVVLIDGTQDFTYIYPRSSDVVVGGTSKVNDWNDKSNVETSVSRLEACRKVMPGLEKARVMSTWVGLRPGRSKIRLTCDTMLPDSSVTIIHCYGHGSKGISLHWGCALEIEKMVSKIIT